MGSISVPTGAPTYLGQVTGASGPVEIVNTGAYPIWVSDNAGVFSGMLGAIQIPGQTSGSWSRNGNVYAVADSSAPSAIPVIVSGKPSGWVPGQTLITTGLVPGQQSQATQSRFFHKNNLGMNDNVLFAIASAAYVLASVEVSLYGIQTSAGTLVPLVFSIYSPITVGFQTYAGGFGSVYNASTTEVQPTHLFVDLKSVVAPVNTPIQCQLNGGLGVTYSTVDMYITLLYSEIQVAS